MIKALFTFRKITSYCKTCLKKIYFHSSLGKKSKRYRPKLEETKEKYSVKGKKYTQKRHAMHMNIVNEFMKKASSPKKGERPIAVLIGGGTASGKTTMRQNIIEKKLNKIGIHTVTVDPDEIKEYIPEYASLKKSIRMKLLVLSIKNRLILASC